jgi:hypothetical protein
MRREMIVGAYFDGDSDTEVALRQHGVYQKALGIIIESCNRIVRFSKSLLDVDSPDEWGTISSCDHRTLQMAHDLLAAAWRFEHGVRQSRLQLEPKLGPVEADTIENEWLSWLRDEIDGWRWRPEIIRNVQLILTNQNQPVGYNAEGQLCLSILDRFHNVSWKPSLRSACETDLDSVRPDGVTEKANYENVNESKFAVTSDRTFPLIIAGKAFLYFVYYKALSMMLFPKGLTVLAAALIAIAASGIDYVVNQNDVRQRLSAAWVLVVVIVGTYFASLVIAYGFSEAFWLRSFGVSGYGWWSYYKGFFEQNSVRFAATVLPPSIIVFGALTWANRR